MSTLSRKSKLASLVGLGKMLPAKDTGRAQIGSPTGPTFAISSSLAGVLKVQTCLKRDDDFPLALFHAKFWGKSMKDEEEKWRNTQTVSRGQRMDSDRDGGEICGESENEDEDEGTDDIIPGCYDLDINIVNIPPPRIWIRADYIRIYDFFQSHYNKFVKPSMDRPPSAVLTGQPGIGKSIWIIYAARRCADEMRPFIWFYARNYYLFVNEGVYELPPNWKHDNFRFTIWALVDSDESKDGIPPDVIPHGASTFVIYITSPDGRRWSRMCKTTQRVVVIMNPWSREEIWRAALLSVPNGKMVTKMHLDETFDTLGPIPRLCIEHSFYELEQYKSELDIAISSTTMDQMQKLAGNTSNLTMDTISHKIFLLSRKDQDSVVSPVVISLMTNPIKSRLASQLRDLELGEQIRLYKQFQRVSQSRGTAGHIYEAIVQSRLQAGIRLELIPMVKLRDSGKRKRSDPDTRAPQPQWHSSHIHFHNPALESSRKQALDKLLVVNIRPKRMLEYSDNRFILEPDVLYVPELTNQMVFDSFILLSGVLYIFQITIASNHTINRRLVDVASKFGFPSMDKWQFVFIIPPNTALTVPHQRSQVLQSFSLYSAEVHGDDTVV